MDSNSSSDSEMERFYKSTAVVGMSKNEDKPAHFVPRSNIEHGYNVSPVIPTLTAAYLKSKSLGRKSYVIIADTSEKIDIEVFRRSEDVRPIVSNAIKKVVHHEAKVIWMQSGLYNEQAEKNLL
ncbi:MAG TPA: CoA-binding protein [Nitrososphaeraceae archaeon]|jgi:hypothetical protein|nr:CoA-binding protein [Nitrososphaeraceae archaeon]